MKTAPYGSWDSPIGAREVARGGIRLSDPRLADDGSAWWLEGRPLEGGRYVLVREGEDVTPAPFNVRTLVHEYGGGAWLLSGETVFFSNFADQRLHRLDPGGEAQAITPEGPTRYADGRATPVCVRETHGDGEPVNEVVAVPADGTGEQRVLASGRDFYSFPTVSPDGATVCWTCWDHPNMPWDGTELWVAPLDRPEEARLVTGGADESIWQPSFAADGTLHWISDTTGWWNLYRVGEQLTDVRADLGYPQWLFGGSTYAFLDDGTISVIRTDNGEERLCLLRNGAVEELDLPYTCYAFPSLRSRGSRLIF